MTDLAQRIATLPPSPDRLFASDNAAGAHPAVVDAVARANRGHVLAYGSDDLTRTVEGEFARLFGVEECPTFLVWNGTGANVVALSSALRPAEAVVCTEWAHIAVDEAGAPERILGAKLITVPSEDAKLRPDDLARLDHLRGVEHHAQPAVVSITQSTELGTVYSPAEVRALCEAAHQRGMFVHLDGARIANAAAALGGVEALRAFTVEAGVDMLSFGGTKNGLLGAEAVVFLNPSLGRSGKLLRKMVTQLPSKMRFVAAQFMALLSDDLWLSNASAANSMATALYEATVDIPGVGIASPPQVNSLFVTLPAEVIEPLRAWSFFWDWDESTHLVRWMTAWDTTRDDVDRFAAGVRHLLC